MTYSKNLSGQLLISQPKNQDSFFSKSVVLIAQHNHTGAWGVVVNKLSKTVKIHNIMSAVGIENYHGNDLVYSGGPVETARVQIVHTLDWQSPTTMEVTKDIGITGDVSILAAISLGKGPKLFRPGVGLSIWRPGQLEGEQSGLEPWTERHRWLTTPATIDLCFDRSGPEQWQLALDHCVNQSIAELF